MATANLTVRIDAGIKNEAEKLFDDLGMSISTAFNIFLFIANLYDIFNNLNNHTTPFFIF